MPKILTEKTLNTVRKHNKYFRIIQFVSWNVQYLEHTIRTDGQERDKFVEQAREWHSDPRSYFTISKRRSRCFNTDNFVYIHMFHLGSLILLRLTTFSFSFVQNYTLYSFTWSSPNTEKDVVIIMWNK